MAFVLGIDVGTGQTAHATVQTDGPVGAGVRGGAIASAVALAAAGGLVAGSDVIDGATGLTSGFVERLGDPAPVMIDGTPYGVESLVGVLVSTILRVTSADHGEPPLAVAFAHVDGLDDYRTGLLIEATRLAGVPVADVALVSHSEALAALRAAGIDVAPELQIATGAALVERARRAEAAAASSEPPTGTLGIVAGGAAAAGGVALGASVLGDATSAAPTAAAGAAYTGTPMTPTGAAYSGTPLTSSGAAYGGTPLTTSGAGYTGTPIATSGAAYEGTSLTPDDSGKRPGKLRPRRLPIIAGAVAVVAIAAGAAIAMSSNDDPSASPATTPIAVATTPPADTATTPVAPATTVASPANCATGTWTVPNESVETIFEAHYLIYENAFAQSVGAGPETFRSFSQVQPGAASGSVHADIAADGTWTITYDEWTMFFTDPVSADRVDEDDHSLSGVETAHTEIGDDDSIVFTPISSSGSGLFHSIFRFHGEEIESFSLAAAFTGEGTITCSGDQMTLQLDSLPSPLLLDRSA